MLLGGTSVPYSDNAIMVSAWDTLSAYAVRLPFYLAWRLGAPSPWPATKIGIPLMNEIPGGTGQDCGIYGDCCPTSEGCTKYQRFSHGYIWENSVSGVQTAVFCPDIASLPSTGPDYIVDLLLDVLGVIQHYQPAAGGAPPYDPLFDLNIDGVIDLLNDILVAANHANKICVPGHDP